MDFTALPLLGCSLFAITGPTGAGKTTLLDAVTLALYGKAARYANDANPIDMMSRHTGHCLAEVILQTKAGIYRAEWQLHRSRNSPDGAVQPPKRFIYDANETPLNRTQKECQQIIDDLLGLDYQRFLRSVLLAQGEFARFLKADANARAELLESLTGTEIYSDLGRLAHEITMEKDRDCQEWRRKLTFVTLLSDEERAELTSSITSLATSISERAVLMEALRLKISTQQAVAQATEERDLSQKAWRELQTLDQSFQQQRQQLALHHKALSAQAGILRWRDATSRLAIAIDQAKTATTSSTTARHDWQLCLAQARHFCENLSSQILQREQTLQAEHLAAEKKRYDSQAWLDAHNHHAALPSTLHELLQLHQNIEAKNALLQITASEIEQIEQSLAHTQQQFPLAEKECHNAEKSLHDSKQLRLSIIQQMVAYQSHPDEMPAETLLFLQSQINSCEAAIRLHDDVRTTEELREKLVAERQTESKEIDILTKKTHSALLEKNLREDHFLLATTASSLEEHRKQLQDGKPCPLCGSTHHPWQAGQQSPALSDVEAAYRAAELALRQLQSELSKRQSHSNSLEQRIADLQESLNAWRNDPAASRSRVESEKIKADLIRKSTAFTQAMSCLTVAESACSAAQLLQQQAATCLDELTRQRAKFRERMATQQAQMVDSKQRIASLNSTLTARLAEFHLTSNDPATWKESALAFQSAKEQLQSAELSISQLQQQLQQQRVLGEKISELTQPWQAEDVPLVLHAPSTWRTPDDVKSALAQSHEKHKQAMQQSEWAMSAEKNHHSELSVAVAELKKQSAALGFSSIDDISIALMDHEDFTHRSATLNAHDVQKTRLQTSLATAQGRLTELMKQVDGSDASLLELKRNLQEIDQQQAQHIEQHSLAKDRHSRDAAARLSYAEGISTLSTMVQDLSHWQIMRELIGSHDGAKFRRHAQSISLDQLLQFANLHMATLNSRYSMRRSTQGELHLEIIDHYQNNTTRSMNSLSGGESFLASLALALALSDIAGRKQTIESLFIDEGFGTLDSDTLDTAISTLESLQQRGKTIGVISHVETLKDRIRVQINIEKKSSGHSAIRLLGA